MCSDKKDLKEKLQVGIDDMEANRVYFLDIINNYVSKLSKEIKIDK